MEWEGAGTGTGAGAEMRFLFLFLLHRSHSNPMSLNCSPSPSIAFTRNLNSFVSTLSGSAAKCKRSPLVITGHSLPPPMPCLLFAKKSLLLTTTLNLWNISIAGLGIGIRFGDCLLSTKYKS
ncbi:hypothetical protein SESBI_49476 [Sesbania bispinosa]|nr:hypothetical protein SESBI_49476 [Sesbania bispinosa]